MPRKSNSPKKSGSKRSASKRSGSKSKRSASKRSAGRVKQSQSNPCSLRTKAQCGGDPSCHYVKNRGCLRRSGAASGKKQYEGPTMPIGPQAVPNFTPSVRAPAVSNFTPSVSALPAKKLPNFTPIKPVNEEFMNIGSLFDFRSRVASQNKKKLHHSRVKKNKKSHTSPKKKSLKKKSPKKKSPKK